MIQKLHAYLVLTFLQGRYKKKVLTYYVVGYAKDGSSVPRVSILYMDIWQKNPDSQINFKE